MKASAKEMGTKLKESVSVCCVHRCWALHHAASNCGMTDSVVDEENLSAPAVAQTEAAARTAGEQAQHLRQSMRNGNEGFA